jgi:hypothetical protein
VTIDLTDRLELHPSSLLPGYLVPGTVVLPLPGGWGTVLPDTVPVFNDRRWITGYYIIDFYPVPT